MSTAVATEVRVCVGEECGAYLRSTNPGPLCSPCQKRRGEGGDFVANGRNPNGVPAEERRSMLLSALRADPGLTVAMLGGKLGVCTDRQVRRDLDVLVERGEVRREWRGQVLQPGRRPQGRYLCHYAVEAAEQ